MPNPDKPTKKLVVEPGESPWLALAREVATNPDGPIALQAISGINRMMRPRELAIQRLVEALARTILEPGEPARADLEAAKAGWEAACGGTLDKDLLAGFEKDARALIERRKTQPPDLESILGPLPGRTDYGYDLGLDLGGLRGTWHRLWGSISMAKLFGSPEGETLVKDLRLEFEQQLGRAMSEVEWTQLVAHAHRHCDTVSKPMLDAYDRKPPGAPEA
jgi:hypothetical protein